MSKFVFLFLLLIIISCWFLYDYLPNSKYNELMENINKNNSQSLIVDGEKGPPFPSFFKNNFSILGVDSNNNGIRDDVDIWINQKGIDYNERMAMRQLAKTLTKLIIACEKNDIGKVGSLGSKYLNDSSCLSFLSDHKRRKRLETTKNIKELVRNMNKRTCKEFYKNHSATISTGVMKEPHLYCEFNILNIKIEQEEFEKFYNR